MHDVTEVLPGNTSHVLMQCISLTQMINNNEDVANGYHVHATKVSCPQTGLF